MWLRHSVLCDRLKPFVNKLIGSFRPAKSTLDQISSQRQILENTRDKQIDTFHVIIDFIFVFDTSDSDHLYAIMSEIGIPANPIRLCEMTLKNAKCVVKVGNNLFEPIDAMRGFRQGNSLCCDFFNILMERIICAASLRHTGAIFYKSITPLTYTATIHIMGRIELEVAVAFSKFDNEARRIGLELI